eukprot:jgi/Chrpa1/12622/Chrysochromulina_OHIO_Genome00016293-RA
MPPAWTTQSMAPAAVTCITNASSLPRLMSDVEPNDASPLKEPDTRKPSTPSWPPTRAMLLPESNSAPPAWKAQSMAPDAVTCITKTSELPRLVSNVEPNDALPLKSPVTRAPPAPSYATPKPQESAVPPAWTAQSTTPAAVTCITKASTLVSPFVSTVEPNDASP